MLQTRFQEAFKEHSFGGGVAMRTMPVLYCMIGVCSKVKKYPEFCSIYFISTHFLHSTFYWNSPQFKIIKFIYIFKISILS